MQRHRILVVDDDPAVRLSCERIFADRGYEVETAATGEEGIERARTGYYDCALLDLKMPDIDGMELVRLARAQRDSMAVLVITGNSSVDTAVEATRLGVSDYVCKPFSPEEIADAVERALQAHPRKGAIVQMDRLVREIRESAPKPADLVHHSPAGVAGMVTKGVGAKKAAISVMEAVVLGIMAGVYIGFGAALATLVAHDAGKVLGLGLTKLVVGGVFSVGLMLVVIAGAELFTGNNLMVAGALGREYGWRRMLNRWTIVYLANFVGAAGLAYMMYQTGLWKAASYAVGAKAIAMADAKVHLAFGEAFFRAVGCNWLVCLAVWMALSAKEIAGKILAIFFPIMAFVALGFEHCVANMYFVPMGIFLKGTPAAVGMNLDGLTWSSFVTVNLVPVTIGNIVGGAIFVGTAYWWVYARGAGKQPGAASAKS